MRHGDKIKNLGRTASHRRALLSNLTIQLIEHKRITTTLAKAKSLRVYAEPIINRAKEDTTHNRRLVFSYLQSKEAIKELFGVVAEKIADRPGGYTRIIKLAPRMGDAAEMAMIELVDFNELYKKDSTDAAAKKTRRSRRGGGGGTKAAAAMTTASNEPAEATMADEQADNAGGDNDTNEVSAGTEAPATTDTAAPAQSEETGENDSLANTPTTEGDEEKAA